MIYLNEFDGGADLFIYDSIYDGEEIRDVIDQIKNSNAPVLNVRINSYGGEISTGYTVYNAIKNHQGVVRTYCDGFACSIASVIFMAGTERHMSDAGFLMIHDPSIMARGSADELRKEAATLDQMKDSLIKIYANETGLEADEISKMMSGETWLGADEAVEMGFATVKDGTELKGYANDIAKYVKNRLLDSKKDEPFNDLIIRKLDGLESLLKGREEVEEVEEVVQETSKEEPKAVNILQKLIQDITQGEKING